MSAKTITDPVTGKTLTAEESRRSGALVCLASLPQLLAAASDMPDDAAGFYSKQHADARAFAASLGPMTPFAEGVITALAEYIHQWETTGGPNLELWVPEAAKTMAERKRDIEAGQHEMAEPDGEAAKPKEVAVLPAPTLLADLVITDGQVIMSERRATIAFDAASEIEELCVALVRATVDSDKSRVVRGIGKRIEDMAIAIMGALDDDMHQTDDLASKVLGKEAESCPA